MNGNWISFSSTAQEADYLMDTEFLTYRSTTSEQDLAIVRTRNVFLPQSIMQYVQMIHPTTHFSTKAPQPNPVQLFSRVETKKVAVPCEKSTTPQCLRDLYKIVGVVPNKDTSGFVGIAGFLDEYPSHSDLDSMIAKTSPWAKDANYTSYSLQSQYFQN